MPAAGIRSGRNPERPELVNCLKALRPGDVLVVWRLDRLGRNLPDMVRIVIQSARTPLNPDR
ncbi:MAG: recombinase family protein [Bryobacteraceae bacterium]|nr:recombinase family protein [Bryobacteraceae bacterium]